MDEPVEIEIIHKRCGGVAFVYDHLPRKDDAMHAANVVRPNVVDGELVKCDACGLPVLSPTSLTWKDKDW